MYLLPVFTCYLNQFFINFSASVINTRMGSLRNAYQKLHRKAPSGAAAMPKTNRQREVLRLCWFLREHIKTGDSTTNYKSKLNKLVIMEYVSSFVRISCVRLIVSLNINVYIVLVRATA